ncbi:YxeA family protein [Rhodoligotrophos ferricapiens]|uniref:YxeA family protein n=1 Tax=Rhodoligotrophos ferricapiens TaxID=3069264 RepID=UPI00315D7B13
MKYIGAYIAFLLGIIALVYIGITHFIKPFYCYASVAHSRDVFVLSTGDYRYVFSCYTEDGDEISNKVFFSTEQLPDDMYLKITTDFDHTQIDWEAVSLDDIPPAARKRLQ